MRLFRGDECLGNEQYTFNTRGEEAVELSPTYSGDDAGRTLAIFGNDLLIGQQELKADKHGGFIEKRCLIPAAVLESVRECRVTVTFVAARGLAEGVYDVRLLRPGFPVP